jgi:hypothetical protein
MDKSRAKKGAICIMGWNQAILLNLLIVGINFGARLFHRYCGQKAQVQQ